jgi:hypothetical protein
MASNPSSSDMSTVADTDEPWTLEEDRQRELAHRRRGDPLPIEGERDVTFLCTRDGSSLCR